MNKARVEVRDLKIARLVIVLAGSILSIALSGCRGDVLNREKNSDRNSTANVMDFESLGIAPKELYDENDKLNNLVAALETAIAYSDDFSDEQLNNNLWQDEFMYTYVLNTNFAPEYLMEIYEDEGIATKDEVEYIHYSLTGEYKPLDIDDKVDIRQTSSGWWSAQFENYQYENLDGEEYITGIVKKDVVGNNYSLVYDVVAKLIRNPYSCFDGYSIDSIQCTDITPDMEADGAIHRFEGILPGKEDIEDGVFTIDYCGCDDEIVYSMIVEANLTNHPELISTAEQFANRMCTIEYIFDKTQKYCISQVEPISIDISTDRN